MARLGLGENWSCLFSNDFDIKKVAAYKTNFAPANELHFGDVAKVETTQLPGTPTLAWASFPCQDLSLAGNGKGLAGNRSGVFWAFWKLMQELKIENRNPPIIALENVSGLITSHDGQDLMNLTASLVAGGYKVGAVLIDGALFVSQSRPRLFIVAVGKDVAIPKELTSRIPSPFWCPKSLQEVVSTFPEKIRKNWIWWKLPIPKTEAPHLAEIIEHNPNGIAWHSREETKYLLDMMSEKNLAKVNLAKSSKSLQVGTIYKRTRSGIQRAEVRFDGVSGCLRTPSGGSSRQIIMVVDGNSVRTRLISARETARLMGLPETYKLPEKYNDAYHLTGDGVVVPAVSWLELNILRPLALSTKLTPIKNINIKKMHS